MKITDFKNIVIPQLKAYTGFPIIKADQMGESPQTPHMTYKITLPYTKGVGQPDLLLGENLTYKEAYQATVSFTAYAFDDDVSMELAQTAHDWFNFHGVQLLQENDVVVSELTEVQNRDAILLEEYERRNGFDCIMRLSRIVEVQGNGYFDDVEIQNENGGI